MKKITVLLMSLIMVFALAACGGGSGSEGESGTTMTVVMEIDYPDESGLAEVEDVKVEIPEGGSVLDALNAYADANGCEIVMDNSSEMPYVTSIGGVAATATAGWVYEVNDEMVMETADACVLKNGDEVSWSFESWGE